MVVEERTVRLRDIEFVIKKGLVPACEPLLAEGRYNGSSIQPIDLNSIDCGLRQISPKNAIAYTLGKTIYKKGILSGREMIAFYVPVQFWAERT